MDRNVAAARSDRTDVNDVAGRRGRGRSGNGGRSAQVDLRRAAQLEALLALLRATPGRSLTSVRATIAQGLTSDLETQRARDSILEYLGPSPGGQQKSR
jgi:hypothetical protein